MRAERSRTLPPQLNIHSKLIVISFNMPKVGNKHYPYTKEGKAAAKKAKQKMMEKKTKRTKKKQKKY